MQCQDGPHTGGQCGCVTIYSPLKQSEHWRLMSSKTGSHVFNLTFAQVKEQRMQPTVSVWWALGCISNCLYIKTKPYSGIFCSKATIRCLFCTASICKLHFHLCNPDHRVGLLHICLRVRFLFDYLYMEHWPELGYLGSTVIQTHAGRWVTG